MRLDSSTFSAGIASEKPRDNKEQEHGVKYAIHIGKFCQDKCQLSIRNKNSLAQMLPAVIYTLLV